MKNNNLFKTGKTFFVPQMLPKNFLGNSTVVLVSLFFALSIYISSSALASGRKIHLVLSVDWEGDLLSSNNIAALENFRNRYPQIKLVHFLNAAYFVKAGNRTEAVKTSMLRGIRQGDQLGLHIHGWQSLVSASGVAYRNGPSFWRDGVADNNDEYIGDRGHDVFLGTYTVLEIRKIIRYSLNVLANNGFSDLNLFRAGGWHLNDNVREALAAEGIRKDSSAVPVDLLREEIGARPLYRELSQIWSNINIFSLPYSISTSSGIIEEYPNNTALADYVSGEDAFGVFKQIIQNSHENEVYLHYGFHHETAARFLPRVEFALEQLLGYAEEMNDTIVYSVLD